MNRVWNESLGVWVLQPPYRQGSHDERSRSASPVSRRSPVPAIPHTHDNASVTASSSATASEADCCAVCLEELELNPELARLATCMHSFHFQCIKAWSEISAKCPLCKTAFELIYHRIRSDSEYEVFEVPISHRVPQQRRINSSSTSNAQFSRRFSNFPVAPVWGQSDASSDLRRVFDTPSSAEDSVRPYFSRVARSLVSTSSDLPIPVPTWTSDTLPVAAHQIVPGISNVLAQQIECLDDLHWRRLVYIQNPISPTDADSLLANTIAVPSARQLNDISTWLEREIRALTDDSDPSLLVHFVQSVFASTTSRSSAFDWTHARHQLERFFASHTATFIRELLSVCASRQPLLMYDRLQKQTHIEQFILRRAMSSHPRSVFDSTAGPRHSTESMFSAAAHVRRADTSQRRSLQRRRSSSPKQRQSHNTRSRTPPRRSQRSQRSVTPSALESNNVSASVDDDESRLRKELAAINQRLAIQRALLVKLDAELHTHSSST